MLLQVPDSLIYTVLSVCHGNLSAGHPGFDRTLKRVQEKYVFPQMRKFIDVFCKDCISCREVKGSKLKPVGIYFYP